MMNKNKRTLLIRIFLVVVVSALSIIWLIKTPSGIFGKTDSIAYAVCHRMESHSYHMGERPMPLCARDTGMHLGILISILFHLKWGKKAGMPARKIQIVLGIFFLAFAIDGVNSTLPMLNIIKLDQWYEPQNWLRLATGAGLGIAMGSVLTPVINESLWTNVDQESALSSWSRLGQIVLVTAIASFTVTTEIPVLVYPLAILTAADVLLILTLIFTIVWVMITKKDNLFQQWKDLVWWLVAGFGTALALIAFMDWMRFSLTGTWEGFVF
jgi:uncharacterized membrane protein